MSEKDHDQTLEEGSSKQHKGQASTDPGRWDKYKWILQPIISVAGFALLALVGFSCNSLQSSIDNVKQDVRNLTIRVYQVDDKMEKLTGDVSYIKGRIKNLLPASKPAKIVRGK